VALLVFEWKILFGDRLISAGGLELLFHLVFFLPLLIYLSSSSVFFFFFNFCRF